MSNLSPTEPPSFPRTTADGVEFLNPPVVDGINNPRESHLLNYLTLAGILLAILAVFIIALNIAADVLAPHIPFRWEQSVAGQELFASPLETPGQARQDALRKLGKRLMAVMDLPPDMDIHIRYSSSSIPNAFATLGGNIVVFQGLIDLVGSEDELAMVLAHEIGHVKNRDPVKGIVRVAGLVLLLAGAGDLGADAGRLAGLGSSGYSRRQETAADREAVRALGRVYGHGGGATAFFTTLAERMENRSVDEETPRYASLVASHPDTLYRLRLVREEAEACGYSPDGAVTPLPEVYRQGDP